jgi:hypothetical protein
MRKESKKCNSWNSEYSFIAATLNFNLKFYISNSFNLNIQFDLLTLVLCT